MATLSLPTSPSTAVWKLIKAQIKADSVLSQSGITLLFFDNSDAPKTLTDYQGAAVLFYATLGRMDWFDEASQSGALIVNYETVIPAVDDEDALNLQSAIQNAVYPDDGFAFGQSLIAAGAVTGLIRFQQPITAPMTIAGREGVMRGVGVFTVEIDTPLSP